MPGFNGGRIGEASREVLGDVFVEVVADVIGVVDARFSGCGGDDTRRRPFWPSDTELARS